jgi:formylmethanofuran dehydrogenase subunit B
MTVPPTTDSPALAERWTCPFCPLLCDDLQARPPVSGAPKTGADQPQRWLLSGGRCARADAALQHFPAVSAAAGPTVDGAPVALDTALDAAAAVLAASHAPLFGGLGTDVAGGRALYRLACATGAVCDAAAGPAMMAALRALQDRGGFTATLAELRSRADLVLCIGGDPSANAPRLFERPDGQPPHLRVQLGGAAPADAAVQHVPGRGDLFDTLAELAALLAGRAVPQPDPALQALVARLQAAAYTVVVVEPALWGVDAGLVVEATNRLVSLLNQRQRAAALWLGGGEGAATVNQVFSWLSGLPLRSRAGPRGLEHDPLAFDAQRLLRDGGADSLLWIGSFGPEPAPPPNDLPMVVLGHPAMALPARRARTVFIPVTTPGIGSAGHLVRTDGTVLLPLFAARADGLPGVAAVVDQLLARLQAPAWRVVAAAAEVAHG